MDFENLHQILRSLYDEMMPLCEDMAGVAKGIAGLGALFYVAYRVWQSLARAEPIDVFPMLRPFAIGLCIMFFPTVVLGTLSGVLSPIVQGTAKMLETETLDMNEYREQKDKLEYEAMKRNPETAYLVSNEEFDKQLEELGWSPDDLVTMAGMYIERSMYQMKKGVRDFFRELLELLFQAAALVIDTLRTFFLVVLSILGPIAFAISVWDGFQTFIRIPAGALLAAFALGEVDPAWMVAAGLIGGTITAGTHFAKAGSRLAINTSPEPFSNWIASFGEEGMVLGGLWTMLASPVVFLCFLLVFLILAGWLLTRFWSLLSRLLRRS